MRSRALQQLSGFRLSHIVTPKATRVVKHPGGRCSDRFDKRKFYLEVLVLIGERQRDGEIEVQRGKRKKKTEGMEKSYQLGGNMRDSGKS